jgi:hypothetical protein
VVCSLRVSPNPDVSPAICCGTLKSVGYDNRRAGLPADYGLASATQLPVEAAPAGVLK